MKIEFEILSCYGLTTHHCKASNLVNLKIKVRHASTIVWIDQPAIRFGTPRCYSVLCPNQYRERAKRKHERKRERRVGARRG